MKFRYLFNVIFCLVSLAAGASPATEAYLHGGTIRFKAERNTTSKKAVFSFEMKGDEIDLEL